MTTRQKKSNRYARRDRARSLLNAVTDWFARVTDSGAKRSHALDLLALEDRVLFNAAPIGDALPDVGEAVSEQVDEVIHLIDLVVQDQTHITDIDLLTDAALPEELADDNVSPQLDDVGVIDAALSPDALVSDSDAERYEIIFVDEAVTDYEALVQDIQAQQNSGSQLEVVVIHRDESGIARISAELSNRQGVDAVHFVSHGNGLGVQLGTDWLNSDTVDDYAWQIDEWRFALNEDADMLFYGCDLASTSEGRELIQSLATACDCDVAASDDDTGSSLHNGDWDLEFATGTIEATTPFSEALQAEWSGTLTSFAVSNTSDLVNGDTSSVAALLTSDGGDGISLREAILAANNDSGVQDQIVLPSGTYTLTGGELAISDNLILIGDGARTTIVDGNGLDRVFHTTGSAVATLSGLTIQGGNQNNGGGVFVDNSSTLNLSDATLTNNTNSGNGGGAVHVKGTLYLDRVLLVANTAMDGGAIGFHGAIGGSLTNVTVAENMATQQGGGLWTDTPITIVNSTIANNTALAGGGVYDKNGDITITSSILDNPGSDNSNTALMSGGYNIDSDGTAALSTTGDQSNIDPLLGALGNYGGPTDTLPIYSNSPAVGAGTNSGTPTVDQRGELRDAAPDVGAYEFIPAELFATGELLVNTTTTGSQQTNAANRGSQQAVALADDGSYVVTWSSLNQDGSGWGVYAQRFDATGTALTSELQVNQSTINDQDWARVVSSPDGSFIVTWTSKHGANAEDVYFRRFAANGTAITGELLANNTVAETQKNSVIALDSSGDFVVAWEGAGPGDTASIFFRRFNADGSAKDAVDRLATPAGAGSEQDAAIAMLTGGKFVIAWERAENNHVYFQLFDASGGFVGSETQIDSLLSTSKGIAIAATESGDFSVVYREEFLLPGVWEQGFHEDGTQNYPSSQVASGDAASPSIAMLSDGSHIVTWQKTGDGLDVFAVVENSSGSTVASSFLVNQTTTGSQSLSSVAALDANNYVVVWSGNGASDTDGVFARQFGTVIGNSSPIANAGGPYTIEEGGTLSLDASASTDADFDPLTYRWDLDNDGVFGEAGEPATATATVTWATLQSFGIDDDGVYTIGLRVDDGNGGVTASTATLIVKNVAPVLSVSGASTAAVGTTYTLNLSAMDFGADTISSWQINWGDGSIETIAGNPSSVGHTYANIGFTNNIVVSATDEDGTFTTSQLAVAGPGTGEVFFFDGDDGSLLAQTSSPGNPVSAQIGPDGLLYVSGFVDSTVRRFDPVTHALVDVFVTSGAGGLNNAGRLAFGPDGNLYVSSSTGDEVLRFSGTNGSFLGKFIEGASSGGLDAPDGITFGPDGSLYVASSNTSQILRYDGDTGAFQGVFASTGSSGYTNIHFGPNGNLFVASVNLNSVQEFDGTTGTLIGAFITPGSGGISGAADFVWGPDGNVYVTGFSSHDILRYDGASGAFIDTFVAAGTGGLNSPIDLAFTPQQQVTVIGLPDALDDSYGLAEGGTLNQSVIADWLNPNWKYRQLLTFNNTGGTTDLNDVAVLVKLHASAPDAIQIDYANTQDAGQDLRFIDADGTPLDHQIELWDESGYSYVWVRVPQVDANSATDSILMYYGNAAAADGQSPESVWNSSYAAVYHMNTTGLDSTANSNDGGVSNVVVATGAIAGAGDFNGIDSYINALSDTSVDNIFAGGGTISAWINPTGWGEGGYGRIADKGTSNTSALGWGLQLAGITTSDGYLLFESDFSGGVGRWRTASGSISLNTWQNVVLTYDNSSTLNTPRVFVNGVELAVTQTATPSGTAQSDAAQNLFIGNRSNATDRTFQGALDEVRLLNSSLSPAEVIAQYEIGAGLFVSGNTAETGPGGLLQNDSHTQSLPLTVSLVTGPAHAASFTLDASGAFTYEHDGSETTSDSFVYQISDGTLTDTATVVLTISPTNDAPTNITLDNLTVSENSEAVVIGNLSTIDPDSSDSHTYSVDDARFEVVTGQLKLKAGQSLDFETEPSVSVNVTSTDTGGLTVLRNFVLLVTDQNEPPTAIGDSATTTINVPVVINVTANDNDPESDTLTVLDAGGASSGKLANNDDGTVTYTPNAGFSGSDAFNYVITDGQDGLTHYWALAGNGSDAVGGADGTLNNGVSTIAGSYGDALFFDEVNDYVALPDISYNNEFTVSFKFRVDDNVGSNYIYMYSHGDATASNSLSIFIGESGQGTYANQLKTVFGDSNDPYDPFPAGINISSIVGDGLWHSYALTVDAANGMQVYLDGTLRQSNASIGGDSFNPNSNLFLGTRNDLDPARFYGGGLDSVAIFDRSLSASEVSALTAAVFTTTHTSAATVNVTVGNLPPVANAGGPYNISEGANVALDGSLSSDDGGITAYAWDLDSDGNFGEPGEPTSATPMVSWTTLQSFGITNDGVYTIGLQVMDSSGATSATTAQLTVNNVAPTITSPATINIAENTTVVQAVTATDPNDSITFAISGGADASRFSLNNTTGELSFASAPNFESPVDAGFDNIYEVEVQASDGDGGIAMRLISVTITPVNDNNPTFTSGATQFIDENLSVVHTLTATDADLPAQSITFTLAGTGADDSLFTIDATNQLKFISAPDYEAPADAGLDNVYNVDVRASDGSGGVAIQSISVTVTPVNEEQTLVKNSAIVVTEGGFVTIDNTRLQTTDVDNTPIELVYSVTAAPTHGAILLSGAATTTFTQDDLDNNRVSYQHDGSETTSDSFGFSVDDGFGTPSNATFTLNIIGVNDAPMAANDPNYTTSEDRILNVSAAAGVLANDTDVDGPLLNAVLIASTSNGVLTLHANGSFEYTPVSNFFGIDTFTYTASDGMLDSNVATATVTVTSVNDAPIAVDNAYSVSEGGGSITGNVITDNTGAGVDSDAEGDALYVLEVNGNTNLVGVPITLASGATLQINQDGTLQYDLNGQFHSLAAGQIANESFSYTLADGWNVRMIQVTGNTIDTTTEAVSIYAGVTGLGSVTIGSETYNVVVFKDGVASEIDYGTGIHGGATDDDFDVNNSFPDGSANGGDNTLVAATATWVVPAGTYTIALGSDDGGVLKLNGETFDSVFNSDITAGTNAIAFDAVRSHGVTGGTFTVTRPTLLTINALAFNRLLDSSFEISVASGTHTSFDGAVGNGGSFALLEEGTLGWSLSQAQASVSIAVQGVNNAPVINTATGYALSPIGDGDFNSPGQTVAQILASVSGTPVSDVDTSVSQIGMAITGESSPNGTWQYSINGGSTWTYLPAVSDDSAVTLAPSAKLRFVPDLGKFGVASFTWRAWDQTTGSNGLTAVDTTPAGGQTAFSSTTAVASIVVADDPQPPQISSESYTVLANSSLIVSSPGLLGNDFDPDAPNPPFPIAGATLVYSAADDRNGNGLWEDTTNLSGFDWLLDSTVTRVANPASILPGIQASYLFDGSGGGTTVSLLDLPNDQSGKPVSFEAWFRPVADGDHDVIFETGGATDGTSLSIDGTTLIFTVKDDTVIEQLTATIGNAEFTQVVGTINQASGDLALYVNGALVATANNPGLIDWADTNGSGLGQVNGSAVVSNATNYEGEIALLRIYESALTPLQVKTNYDSVATGLKVISVVAPTAGVAIVQPDGRFIFDPHGDFDALKATETGNASFEYTVQDGTGLRATTTVNITVQGVNDAPVTAIDSYVVSSGGELVAGAVSSGVLGNDFDPEGNTAGSGTLTASITTPPSKGTLVLNPDGTFVYTSIGGSFGTDEFYYVADDGVTQSVPTRVVITIATAGGPLTSPAIVDVSNTADNVITPTEEATTDSKPKTPPAAPSQQPPAFGLPVDDQTNSTDTHRVDELAALEDGTANEARNDSDQTFAALLQGSDSSTSSFTDPRDRLRVLVQGAVEGTTNSSQLTAGVTQLVTHGELSFVSRSSALWQDLDELEDLVENDIQFEAVEVASALGVTTTLSVGYVLWFLRGTYLVSCILAQMPAWKMVDPLFVFGGGDLLGDDDDESLTAMLQRSNETTKAEASGPAVAEMQSSGE